MAVTKEAIKNSYPLPVYNYKVDVAGETIGFSEISGLNRSYEKITYKESKTAGSSPGPNIMRMPGQLSDVSITMKKGYVKANNIEKLYKWINGTSLNQIEKKDITVSLCDESGAPVVTWNVSNAFPTKLEAPSFNASTNEAAIESMELVVDTVSMSE